MHYTVGMLTETPLVWRHSPCALQVSVNLATFPIFDLLFHLQRVIYKIRLHRLKFHT